MGVNGTGKTTSTAKLSHLLLKQKRSVVLAAADTFRAAAVEQLEVWAKRVNVPLIKGPPNADPSAVCFDAYQNAAANKANFLICDTAGRLHTRHNLMEELRKVERVIGKKDNTGHARSLSPSVGLPPPAATRCSRRVNSTRPSR